MDRRSFLVFVFVIFQAKGQNPMVKAPNETVNEIGNNSLPYSPPHAIYSKKSSFFDHMFVYFELFWFFHNSL